MASLTNIPTRKPGLTKEGPRNPSKRRKPNPSKSSNVNPQSLCVQHVESWLQNNSQASCLQLIHELLRFDTSLHEYVTLPINRIGPYPVEDSIGSQLCISGEWYEFGSPAVTPRINHTNCTINNIPISSKVPKYVLDQIKKTF